jgi:hypothetical protein
LDISAMLEERSPIPLAALRRAAALVVGVVVLTGACAFGRLAPIEPRGAAEVMVPGFDFARDTFAFPNEIRSRHPGVPDLYANYCFVMARSLRQFFLVARFDPSVPKLDHDGYVERIRSVVAHAPWRDPLPLPERVVIPGYANLREFSRGEEAALKKGMGGRFWTVVHWTNWRVTMPETRAGQREVAEQIVADINAGRLVQMLVTNLPTVELNHTVVAFGYRWSRDGLELSVWDPNDPASSGVITFDAAGHGFAATRVYDTRPGPIRVFRMYYSPLL